MFLIDLVPFPVDKLSPDMSEARRLRRAARKAHVAACIDAARSCQPAGVVICHAGVYQDAAAQMRSADLPLLHDESIPFPLYAGRGRFIAAMRAARDRLPAPPAN